MYPLASLAIPLLIVTLGYCASCLVWPYRICRRCDGYGQRYGLFGVVRPCRHCDCTGLRLRLGRRIWNAATRLYRDLHDD